MNLIEKKVLHTYECNLLRWQFSYVLEGMKKFLMQNNTYIPGKIKKNYNNTRAVKLINDFNNRFIINEWTLNQL